jgi:hypothetical protein
VAPVLLVATHPDTSRVPRTSQGNYISSQAERLLTQLNDKFGSIFELHQQVIIVDAHLSSSPGIRAIKSYVANVKQKVLQVCTQKMNQFSPNIYGITSVEYYSILDHLSFLLG